MGWLDRAKRVIRGTASPGSSGPQAYRVACIEGHLLRGERTDGYQSIRCPDCGEAVFILPRSPLPEPISPDPSRARGPRSGARPFEAGPSPVVAEPRPAPAATRSRFARPEPSDDRGPTEVDAEAESVGEIEWVDEASPVAAPIAATVAPAKPARPRPSKPGGSTTVVPKARPHPVADEPVPSGMVRLEERHGRVDWLVRYRNQLILASVLVLVVGTVGYRVRQRRREDYPRLAERGRVEGLAKLDLGEFQVAKQILADAAMAVEALGGQVEGADEIRQGAREAALFADAIDVELEDLIEEAARYDPALWDAHFAATYRGRSILMSATVLASANPGVADAGIDLDYRILYGRNATPAGRGRIDLTGFRLFEQAPPRPGNRVNFGARMAGVRLETTTGFWEVSLEPDSGAFITHDKAMSIVKANDAADDDEDAPR